MKGFGSSEVWVGYYVLRTGQSIARMGMDVSIHRSMTVMTWIERWRCGFM